MVGSCNTDLVVKVKSLPREGETVIGSDLFTNLGGKGANQALAAHLMGSEVILVSKLGNDPYGEAYRKALTERGLSLDALFTDPEAPSGVALIAVDREGKNQIVVAPGANQKLMPEDVEKARALFPGARVLLLQLEIPLNTVMKALEEARAMNLITILNPAPAMELSRDIVKLVDILTPNEREAELLTQERLEKPGRVIRAMRGLIGEGCKRVVVTMGKRGCLLVEKATASFLPAFEVEPVDSTAAGDAFNGVLAACLAEDMKLQEALLWASAAGALCVTRRGAQPSLPTRAEVETFLSTREVPSWVKEEDLLSF